MSHLQRFILHSLTGKVFLCLLAGAYLVYLVAGVRFLSTSLSPPTETILEHSVSANPNLVMMHWTAANMHTATNVDQLIGQDSALSARSDIGLGAGVQQQGQPPRDASLSYPISTVGKVFFSNSAGRNFVCSGTAVTSSNRSVVDTAGHCLYLYGNWVQNMIFCPLYKSGDAPYGCWAARALEVPADWIDAKPNDYHHDFGMAIVAPNSAGDLTDVVGGAGWAYNQPSSLSFSAYGYPAAYPFDGETRQSCENSLGKLWQHGDGTVISIPCNMTGGSSGGPWFMQIGNDWYLNGHNDFISRLQPGHMFSPYYDDTWYALYNKAQQS